MAPTRIITILCEGRDPTLLKVKKTILDRQMLKDSFSKYTVGLSYEMDGKTITILGDDGEIELVQPPGKKFILSMKFGR